MMGTSDISLLFLRGVAPNHSSLFASTSKFTAPLKSHVKSKKNQGSFHLKYQLNARPRSNCLREDKIPVNYRYFKTKLRNKSEHLKFQCQQTEGITGIKGEDNGNGSWLKEVNEELHPSMNGNGNLMLSDDKSVLSGSAKPTSHKKKGSSIEDEAWRLLQESLVYYCGSPVGTIAAKDPTDGNVLNYDHVFIRDFMPSGIAFLLKGYDIVRNFILHTLRLQSWEKTMDCHSPGQGLMPASFKVQIVPLDGDDCN